MKETPREIVREAMTTGCRGMLLSSKMLEETLLFRPFRGKERHAFKVRYIADSITRQRLAVARITGERVAWVSLHSRILQSVCGTQYKEAVAYLMREGVIECDGQWIVGEKCLGYRPSTKAWKSGIVPVPMNWAEMVKYEKARSRLKRARDEKRRSEGVPLDYLHFHLGRLELPFVAVEDLLLADFMDAVESENWKLSERFHFNAMAVSEFLAKEWTFHCCSADRLHYQLTTFPKRYRALLQYAGEGLIEIDVTACQPMLAATLYGRGIDDRKEQTRYLASIESDFYEELGRRAGLSCNRSKLKKEVLKNVFFGGRGVIEKNHPTWVAFQNMFPILSGILLESKQRIPSVWRGDRELAIRLQSAESKVFINGVLQRVANELPHVPAFPIHDCILTTEMNVEAIQEMIREEFWQNFGIIPNLPTAKIS